MKSQDYNILWQRIHKKAKEKKILFRVMFELTYRCNFYCRHCYVPQGYRRRKGELKTREVFSILDQLKDIGCFYLGFTGGEPFIREDIMNILWYAKRKGFEIIIYSNGSLINEKIATELANLRPNKIDITIPAMTEESFEKITQVSGDYKKVFKVIDLLYKKGINLGFKSCVLKENEEEIKDIRNFAESMHSLYRLDDTFMPRLNGSKEPYRYRGSLFNNANIHESNANLRESNHNLRRCLNEDISVNLRAISENSQLFKCGVGQTQAAITPFAELKMCLMIDYPKYKILCPQNRKQVTEDKLHKANLKDAWERLKKLVVSIKPDKDYKCDKCGLAPFCKWCPAQAWLYNRTFTSCDSESHTRAELRKQKAELRKMKDRG